MNALGIFNTADLLNFLVAQSTEIIIEMNFWLGMYVTYILDQSFLSFCHILDLVLILITN